MANSNIEALKYINIPGQDVGGGEGVRIEVTPVNDRWLLSKDRNWDEVNLALERRLLGIQSQLTDFVGEPGPLAKSYGLEKPVSGNAARLLAYVGMIDEYRLVEDFHQSEAIKANEAYESEKKQLKQHLKPSSGKYQKAIDGLQERYEPELSFHSDSVREALGVRDLILRKAVIDIFSVSGNSTETGEPLIAQQLLKLFGEAKTTTERGSPKFKSHDPVEYFVDVLGKYLTSTNDIGLFVRHAYRNSPEIIRNLQDCTVLENVLEMAVGKSSIGEDVTEYSKLGKSCLDFLVHRASYLSSTGVKDTYPHLSLLYDLETAAGYGNKIEVLKNISQIIDDRYLGLMVNGKVTDEVKQSVKRHSDLKATLYRVDLQSGQLAPTTITELESMPNELKGYITSPEFLFSSLILADHIVDKYPKYFPIGRSKSLMQLDQIFTRESLKVGGLFTTINSTLLERLPFYLECSLPAVLTKIAKILRFPVEGGALTKEGGALTKQVLDMYRDINEGVPGITADQKVSSIRKIRALAPQVRTDGLGLLQSEATNFYLASFFEQSSNSPEQLSKENGFLWGEVLNNSTWFVSPRGDRFGVNGDPELKNHAIESMTFRTEKDKPREHKVRIVVSGLEEPMDFWLDTRGNLLDGERKVVVFDPLIKERFVNLALKRLFTITSGLLSNDTDRVGEPMSEEGRDQVFRRAHYRIFSSTEKRKITMESHGAQTHAKLIKEIYGIDIFAEIKRRRAIGSLGQDQYLTFVQESAPKFRGNLMLPNELKYDPTLINIPE